MCVRWGGGGIKRRNEAVNVTNHVRVQPARMRASCTVEGGEEHASSPRKEQQCVGQPAVSAQDCKQVPQKAQICCKRITHSRTRTHAHTSKSQR